VNTELMDWMQTIGSVLIPVLAVFFKVYTDKQKLETQAMITENRDLLLETVEKVRFELAETIGNIQTSMVENKTSDEYRDKELERINDEIKSIKRKIDKT